MPRQFSYIAIDKSGRKMRGTIEADNRDQAVKALQRQGLYATSMMDSPSSDEMMNSEGLQWLFDYFGFTFVSQKAMAVYTRKFASMINAGINYSEIFDILSQESDNRRLRRISTKIKETVIQGRKVSEGMALFPTVFSKIYRSMVQAGEVTGRLDQIMNRLADMYEREHELRAQVMSKMYLPIIELIVGMLIIGGVIFVMPRVFQTAFPIFSIGLFASVIELYFFIFLVVMFARTKPGYKIFRSILSVIWPFNVVLRKMSLARFSRLLANMYGAGVPIMVGLDIAGETLVEPDLARGLNHIKMKINQGESLTESIVTSGVFPQSLASMVRTGERSGNIEDTLNKAAEYYEMEVTASSQIMGTVLGVLVYLIILITLALFVINAYTNYYGFVNSFMEN